MVDHLPAIVARSNQLSTQVRKAAEAELSHLVTAGLITPETQAQLSTAVASSAALLSVATPVGARHLERIDTLLSLRIGSTVGRARETLGTIHSSFAEMKGTFHKYRELFYEIKVRKVKIAKLRRDANAAKDELDRDQLEAEADLEQARLDNISSQVAEGEAILQQGIAKAQAASEQYALVCKEAGKEFNAADFQEEELMHFLTAGFWHAASTFKVVDIRDTEMRERQRGYKGPPVTNKQKDEDRHLARGAYWRALVKADVVAFFAALGVNEQELKSYLMKLEEERYNFDIAHGNQPQSFAPRLDDWAVRNARAFLPRAQELVTKYGIERFRRAASILSPAVEDQGVDGDVENKNRKGMQL